MSTTSGAPLLHARICTGGALLTTCRCCRAADKHSSPVTSFVAVIGAHTQLCVCADPPPGCKHNVAPPMTLYMRSKLPVTLAERAGDSPRVLPCCFPAGEERGGQSGCLCDVSMMYYANVVVECVVGGSIYVVC